MRGDARRVVLSTWCAGMQPGVAAADLAPADAFNSTRVHALQYCDGEYRIGRGVESGGIFVFRKIAA